MSSPEPARSAHPARAAGLALIGVAALALVIGVVSLFTGGDDDQPGAQPPGSSSSETATTTGSAGTTPSSESPQPTTGSPTPPAPTTTPAPTGTPGTTTTPPPPVTPTNKVPVRVYNNSNIPNLAARASDDVRKVGWEVVETGNYSQGVIPTTTVYFRPGTDEESSAQQLAQALHAEVKPRFDGIEAAHPGIIVIVTNDYQGPSGKI